MMSHPVWVCGLKRNTIRSSSQAEKVTPCMGVWIETAEVRKAEEEAESHPVWVCGLKPRKRQKNGVTLGHTLYGCVD